MNILFLCISRVWDINGRGIYADLLREFTRRGDTVCIVTPVERRFGEPTQVIEQGNARIVKVRTLNLQKTNAIEKGLGTVLIEALYRKAVKKYFRDVRFDMVLYSTPPITLQAPVKYIKRRDHAFSYLLLKDIFPQNSVDLGLLSEKGIKGLIYGYFRRKEIALYALSDKIGCMSDANVRYLTAHNPSVDEKKAEVCPNSMEIQDVFVPESDRGAIRRKYGLPENKTIFLYGGNLGKPQGIPYMIDFIACCRNDNAFFLIVGDGTEFEKTERFVESQPSDKVKLIKRLPKDEYDRLGAVCDVGLVFLDSRFTIPNYPSRILSYMQAGIPVLALTDRHSDIGQTIIQGGFGWWRESVDPQNAVTVIDEICADDNRSRNRNRQKGENARAYLQAHFSVADAREIILNSYSEWKHNEKPSDSQI